MKTNYTLICLFLVCVFSMTLAKAQSLSATQSTYTGKPMFQILTKRNNATLGIIKVELYPLIAPKHVRNFDSLVSVQFFDTIAFHRVVPGFVIQGGDPNSRHGSPCSWGFGQPGQVTVNAEFTNARHVRGALSAARSNNINSATSQFFICVADAPNLNNSYSLYGRVIDGMKYADTIVNAPRLTTNVHSCAPGVVYTSMPAQKIEMFITYIGSNDTVPNTPNLLAPVNGTLGIDTTTYLPLSWSKVNDAVLYQLEISTDSLFTSIITTTNVPGTTYNKTGLVGYTDYYWRVRTNNGGHLSPFTKFWKFSTSWETSGLNTVSGASAVKVYPNPSNGKFLFTNVQKGQVLEVFDLTGKLMQHSVLTENGYTLNIEGKDKGVYTYRLLSESGNPLQQGRLILR
jgi:peptidyl-prolyl cis-trans isomerase B (cyclophilin B)